MQTDNSSRTTTPQRADVVAAIIRKRYQTILVMTKDECRMTKESRMTNVRIAPPIPDALLRISRIRLSFVIRHSDFSDMLPVRNGRNYRASSCPRLQLLVRSDALHFGHHLEGTPTPVHRFVSLRFHLLIAGTRAQ